MRELWSSILHTSSARIYGLSLGILTLFLTARLLGPEGRGQVAAIITWVNLFFSVAYLSLGQIALNRMAEDRDRRGFGRLLGSLMFLALVLTFGAWLVAAGAYALRPRTAYGGLPGLALVVGFLSLPFLIWEHYGSSLLMGLERIRIYNRYQVIGRTIAVALVLFLVGVMGMGAIGVLGANLVGQAIVALGGMGALLAVAKSKGDACWPEKSEIRALLIGGAKLHLNAVGTYLFTSTNVLILNQYHGAAQTGHFQLAAQLVGVLMIVPQSASMVVYGKVASLGPNDAWPMNRRLLLQVTAGMILLSMAAALLGPPVITLLASERFLPAVPIFRWLLVGLVGMTFSTMMAPQWIGRGYLWQAALTSLLLGLLNLGANLLLIPRGGMQGAVIVFIGTYAACMIINALMALWCQMQMHKQVGRMTDSANQ